MSARALDSLTIFSAADAFCDAIATYTPYRGFRHRQHSPSSGTTRPRACTANCAVTEALCDMAPMTYSPPTARAALVYSLQRLLSSAIVALRNLRYSWLWQGLRKRVPRHNLSSPASCDGCTW